jgi:CDP-diacylglycerol--serine O-phosphatidyltransferase
LPDIALPEDSAKPFRKSPPRAAYALPSLFTAGNIFLGYLSIVRSIQGAINYSGNIATGADHFRVAAQCIGLAVLLDGLDGGIARLTNTTSDFGRELDSLADIISFGIAPAILAYLWGVQFVDTGPALIPVEQFQRAGKLLAFLFLVCGAARLARFNVQKNPQPRNPGVPHRKYFVGLPIPAGAGMIAAVIYAFDSYPVTDFIPALLWLLMLATLSLLMVSTWRYWSFKDLNLLRPRSPILIVVMGGIFFAVWNWSEQVLLIMSCLYVGSGILTRVAGLVRRVFRHTPRPRPETQVG